MTTTDIWFAAFLKFNGYEISDFKVLSRGKGSYEFKISEDEWKEMRMKFLNSESSKIKHVMSELKDLLY